MHLSRQELDSFPAFAKPPFGVWRAGLNIRPLVLPKPGDDRSQHEMDEWAIANALWDACEENADRRLQCEPRPGRSVAEIRVEFPQRPLVSLAVV